MEPRAQSAEEPEPESQEDLRLLARLLNVAAEDDEEASREDEAAEQQPAARTLAPVPAPAVEAPAVEAVEAEPDERESPDGPPADPEDAPDEPASPPTPLVAGRFEVRESLEETPVGRRLLVRDVENQLRELELLVLDGHDARGIARSELEDRLARYADRARGLTHGTIHRLRHVGLTSEGHAWLASDRIDGEDLRALLDRKGALIPRHALEIARQILTGLEHGHARGVAHGAISAETVVLERRVPWTEENPHGVGVLLRDYGLGELVAGETRELDAVGDLRAVGRLLVELLLGSRVEPDDDWQGSGSAVPTADLAVETRRILDSALSRDPRLAFQTAGEFRSALERSRDWRPPRRLTRGWLVTVGLLAGTTAILLLTRFRGASDGEPVRASEPPARTGDPGTPVAGEAARAEVDLELERLRADGAELRGDLHDLQEEGTVWQARAAEREEEALRLAEENRRLAAEREERDARLAEALERIAALERRASEEPEREEAGAAPVPAQVPAQVPALGTVLPEPRAPEELVLERLRALDSPGARDLYERLAPLAPLVDDGPKSHFLDAWTRAALALDAARGEADELARAQRLDAARAAHAEAAERSAVLPGMAPGVERFLADLLGGIEELEDDLARFRERYAEELAGAADRGATLDLRALARFEGLPGWAARLEAEPRSERGAAGDAILLYAFALRFDEGPPTEALPEYGLELALQGLDAPRESWRHRLALAAGLLAPDGGFPGRDGGRSLVHVQTPEGESSWLFSTVRREAVSPAGATAAWSVEERFFDVDGRLAGERAFEIEQHGKRFVSGGRELLDVAHEDFTLRRWSPGPAPAVPPGLPVGEDEVRLFRERLRGSPVDTLVARENDLRRWYAPGLGLVRYADPDRITRELVWKD